MFIVVQIKTSINYNEIFNKSARVLGQKTGPYVLLRFTKCIYKIIKVLQLEMLTKRENCRKKLPKNIDLEDILSEVLSQCHSVVLL